MEHVVIIGAGFGGLYAAQALRREPVRVTVIDRRNHHTFQPLLYQVATAGLNASDIAAPIRRVLRKQKNTSVLLAEATAIDPVKKRVFFEDGELGYDKLIVAAGASHSYFGHDEWAPFAPGLKTVEDALEIRRRVLLAFEAAEREPDPARRSAWMTFVVVGGGPTGVELAGALSELARHTLVREFRRINPRDARILLVEGAGQVLPSYVPELGEKAREQLTALNVEVRTRCLVTGIDEEGVSIGDKRIEAKTVLWGAGVAASPLARSLGAPLDRAGRVLVEPDLTVPGHEDVYVIGDLASLRQEDATPVPGVAPAAIQEGRHAARNIARAVRGLPRLPFRYRDRGSMATIGRAAAVADFGKVKLSGFLAWLAWLFVHVLFLIGFRSRFLVLFSWALSYLTYERASRLITGETPRLLEGHHAPELEPRKDDVALGSQPLAHARTRA
ncbi:NAD(P)/FAD-dependent oxidoreductase [Sorangium sp. So ce1078]|uniref:NAD(P)/FAD-dependent oxidoreductase n=1 Tax=Sorangium sp. So ce1078 TaxID=3133329 RepID=UPI003F5EA819